MSFCEHIFGLLLKYLKACFKSTKITKRVSFLWIPWNWLELRVWRLHRFKSGRALNSSLIHSQGNCKKLRRIWVDDGYPGPKMVAWVAQRFPIVLPVILRTDNVKSFKLLPPEFSPHQWVVERTFAWLDRYCRLSKDYEVLTDSSSAFIHSAMINLILGRLENWW